MNRRLFLLAVAAWAIFGLIGLISTYAHAAEPTVRLNVNLTCAEVNALAQWRGWAEIESRAKAAGASAAQIQAAKRCLPSSSR